MMRVNPLYDSSEGWRESSDNEEEEREQWPLETRSEQVTSAHQSRLTVMNLGREAVEYYARFGRVGSF